MPAKRVGVVISAHCSSHNEGCAEGKVAGQISPGDDVFDRPVRVSEFLALLEPWVALDQETVSSAVVEDAGTSTLHSPSDLADMLSVVRSERVAEDRELVASGVTSRRYLKFLQQRSRELQKKQRLADKWADGAQTDNVEWAFLDTDETTLVNATTEAAARSAVGATLDAVEAVLAGRWRHAFVCARPPGHHNGCCEMLEQIDEGGHVYACHGGCVLNETAIGIRHAQTLMAAKQQAVAAPARAALHAAPKDTGGQPPARKRQAAVSKLPPSSAFPFGSGAKIAVVDIDVHFGDGTALCFYDDPSVRSLHWFCISNPDIVVLVAQPDQRAHQNVGLPSVSSLVCACF